MITILILWLENYLIRYKSSIVMITHDRYFLDKVAKKIIEIDNQSLYSYDGNYSYFLEHKEIREQMDAATQRKKKTNLR